MIGKEVGDVVEVNTPGGVKAYEILKVEWKLSARPDHADASGPSPTAAPASRTRSLGLAEAVARLTPAEVTVERVALECKGFDGRLPAR